MHLCSQLSRLRVLGRFGLLALAAFSFSACTNNLTISTGTSATSSVTSVNPNSGTGSDSNTSGLTLSRVQKNIYDAAGTLDLLGDGSGAMGQLCAASQSGGSATAAGPTTCTCAFTYVNAAGSQIGPVEVDTTYHEQDQIRCPYATIPSDVAYFKVYIHLTNSDTKSNEVTFRFTGSGVSLDLANSLSYSQVSRFQCRDIVTIPYMWDSSVYDPLLSEDPRFSYPLNFYTTNMGRALAVYSGGDSSRGLTAPTGWNCPAIPNDTRTGVDLTLYSVAADSSGSKAIFPPGGSFDRSTYFVAKAKSGVFDVAVNAVALPGVITSTAGDPPPAAPGQKADQPSGYPPLGYGARPIPLQAGGETCPDASTTIPQGFHWAKLWLFRKQLPKRTYPYSNALAQLGSISCNPAPWSGNNAFPTDTQFPDCSGAYSTASFAGSPKGMISRFFEGTGMCMKDVYPGGTTNPLTGMNYDGIAGNSASIPNQAIGIDFTSVAPGTDIYTPNNKDPQWGCSGSTKIDPTQVCNSNNGNMAFDSSPTQGNIDTIQAGPRFDYLFVVTPVTVNRSDMDPTASSTIHSIYTPVRFMSPSDCKSSDPDQPKFPGDCNPSRMLRYEFKKHEVGAPGDPGQDDANRPGDFPVCVLQPN